MNVLWLVVMAFLFIALQSLVFRATNMRRVSYERHFSEDAAYEGNGIELIEVLRNEKLLPVPWLRAESRIPPELAFQQEHLDAREVSGGLYHKSLFYLSPYCQVKRHHAVTLTHRGVYDAGSVALTAGDLFSLATVSLQLNTPCRVAVYPRLLSEDEMPDCANRWLGEHVVRRWIIPDPFLTSGIREYRAGDAMRDIHWRATARTGQMQVKQRDYTSDTRVMVLLNVQGSETQWTDVSGEMECVIEQGIRIAATICMRAVNTGMDAGFAANSAAHADRDTGKTVFVASGGGKARMDAILMAMARMTLHRELNFGTFLDTQMSLRGEDILILSCYDSPDIREHMKRLEANGNNVSFLRIEGGTAA